MQGHPRHGEGVLTKYGLPEGEMATHFSILASRTPGTLWKAKREMLEDDPPPTPRRSEGVQHASGEEWRAITNISSKNGVAGPKQKRRSVVDMSGGNSKARYCKQQYCIGTWNFRSVNQGKLSVVKQEMESEHSHLRNQWTKMMVSGDSKNTVYKIVGEKGRIHWTETLKRGQRQAAEVGVAGVRVLLF